MLKHRFFTSFLSTVLLYIVVGISFFYLSTQTIAVAEKPQEKILSFSLSEYTPEVVPPIEEPIKEEMIEPEPPEPEPIVEEEKIEPIVEEVVPEPIEAKPLPKPIVKKVVKPKKKRIKKKKIKKKPIKKRVSKKKPHTKRKMKKVTKKKVSSSRKFSAAKKNVFLSQIRRRINKNKTYPRIAQRRAMQGTVKARFTILANGNVGNIVVNGPKVFQRSAKNAIKKSFPISVKNAPLSLPTTVNLSLRYQLR